MWLLVTYVTVISQAMVDLRLYDGVHALTAKRTLVSLNMDTLVFAPMYFYYSKGNVGNMAVTRKRFHCQRANMCHFIPYTL